MQKHNGFACRPRLFRRRQEARRFAKLLDDHGDHVGVRVGDQTLHIVFDAAGRFVSGRDRIGKADRAIKEGHAQNRRHGAGLRDDGDAGPAVEPGCGKLDKGQGHAIDEIDEAKTIGPLDHHAGFGGDAGDQRLFGRALGPAFGESRREDDGRAHLATGEGLDGLHDRCAGNGQNRRIHALGQIIDGRQAGPAPDLGALGIDKVNIAAETLAFEIGQHRGAKGARLFRGPDDHDRSGSQEPVKRLRAKGLLRRHSTL